MAQPDRLFLLTWGASVELTSHAGVKINAITLGLKVDERYGYAYRPS